MPAFIPFREVPKGAVFRFDKDGEGVRWKKAGFAAYHAEGGGFEYHCQDPERPSLLVEPLNRWYPAEFGIDGCPPYFLGWTQGYRWNGWATPYFPWKSVLLVAQWVAAWEGEDHEKVVVDEETQRVWLDSRGMMAEGEDPADYYLELEPDELPDGTRVWGVGCESWIWLEKTDTDNETEED